MKTVQVRNDFSAGEINQEALERKDSRAAQNGLKRGRNIRLRNGGGFSRKPGSQRLATLTYGVRGVGYAYDGSSKYSLIFSAGRIDAYVAETGAAAGSITAGCPWNAAQVWELSITPIDERIIVSHRDLGFFVVTRTGPSTFTIGPFTFDGGAGGSLSQPYFRYAPKGISMMPSALTGASITLTFSAAVLKAPEHVGVRFRYMGKEVTINSISSPTVALATVNQTLPETLNLTVGSSKGFKIGDRVEGDTSHAGGYVTAIPNATQVTILLESGLTGFFIPTDKLVGPDAYTTLSASAAVAPAATTIWDEAAVSPARGYPGEVNVHRKRLMVGDWRDSSDAWCASSVRSIQDFDVGSALDDEAISEILTASPKERVRHIVSAETLLILTERNVYYVPEGRENILTPTYSALFKASPVGASGADPVLVEQGVIFVESGQNRIMLCAATGQITSPWSVMDLTRLVPHFVVQPSELAATIGNSEAAERYAYSVNADGSVAVLFSRDDDPIYGWTLWTTNGEVLSMWVVDGISYQLCRRTIAGVSRLFYERLREDWLLDASTPFTNAVGGADLAHLAGQEVFIVEGAACHGKFTVGVGGALTGFTPVGAGPYHAGFSFAVAGETLSPVLLQNINASGPLLRIPRAWITTFETSVFRANGQLMPAYLGIDDDSALPPLRSQTKEWRFLGRSPAPTVSITQDEDLPSPLTILSVTMEVST